jgi:3-methyladenine DNA glycosylase/8-oxoguanine DNA glycosylase
MPTRSLKVPSDYDLARDVCSYGYFLLAPNHWDPASRTLWRVMHAGGRAAVVAVRQPKGAGSPLRLSTSVTLRSSERSVIEQGLSRMLRLDESAETLASFHRVDPRFAPSGRGRLFRSPTLHEDIIKTVTSCNVTWPSTIIMNQRLCEVFGRRGQAPGGVAAHAFPTAAALAKASPATLRARCRVGYRDARIVQLARLMCTSPRHGGIDAAWLEDPSTPDEAIFEALIELPGIGPYAAANIMQLLGRYGRLPLDTESVRHGRTVLGMKGTPASIMKRVHAHFAPFGPHAFRSYWFELWAWYEQRHGPASTWERSKTAKLFTAAALK